MIAAYHEYGALDTKARALYGKRLRADALRAIAKMGSAGAIADALRAEPGWRDTVAALPENAEFSGLVRALRGRPMAAHAALSHYLPGRDRALASFPVLLAELACLLSALRFLRAGEQVDAAALPPLPRGGKLSPAALHGYADLSGLAAAATGTVFAKPLHRLSLTGGVPDEPTAEAALQAVYFGALFSLIDTHYDGTTQAALRRVFGQQVDLFNALTVLRLKRFSIDRTRLTALLLPYHYALRPDGVQALAAAPDSAACLSLLRGTAYAPCFAGAEVTEAEDACRRAFYTLHRIQLQTGPPSVCSLVSCYFLKELETNALITAVEAARYGVSYEDSFAQRLN